MKSSTHDKLVELLDFAKSHQLAELNWEDNGVKIAFKKGAPAAAPASAASPVSVSESVNGTEQKSNRIFITSPIVGTFRRSISKTRPPLIVEGNHVKPGDRMGVVECMKIPTDVVSFCAGQVGEILVADGHVVEYGQPLFSIIPNDPSVEG